MGPPSRYALLLAAQTQSTVAAAHSSPPTQPTIQPTPQPTPHYQPSRRPAQSSFDTSSMSNVEWAKYHLTKLTTASSSEDFATRGCEFLSRHVNITVNGTHVSPKIYAEQWGAAAGLQGSISFTGALETPHVRIPMTQVSSSSDPVIL